MDATIGQCPPTTFSMQDGTKGAFGWVKQSRYMRVQVYKGSLSAVTTTAPVSGPDRMLVNPAERELGES